MCEYLEKAQIQLQKKNMPLWIEPLTFLLGIEFALYTLSRLEQSHIKDTR